MVDNENTNEDFLDDFAEKLLPLPLKARRKTQSVEVDNNRTKTRSKLPEKTVLEAKSQKTAAGNPKDLTMAETLRR